MPDVWMKKEGGCEKHIFSHEKAGITERSLLLLAGEEAGRPTAFAQRI